MKRKWVSSGSAYARTPSLFTTLTQTAHRQKYHAMSDAGAPFIVCFSLTTTVYATSEQEAQIKAWEIVNGAVTDRTEIDLALEYADEIPTA